MIKASSKIELDKLLTEERKKKKNNSNCHCKAIADITPPHYFGTSVSMVTTFWILSTRQKLPHNTVDIPTKFNEVWWKESIFFKSPLFRFHGNCGKVCPTDSDFFGLSRSTTCGCCSYQVSSISVQRVTCYDHFCVFHFFSILAVSMAMAAILKKSTLYSTNSHGIWYSYKDS